MDNEVDVNLVRQLREQLVTVSRRGYEKGLVPGVSGNNSLRVPETDLILIKATDSCKGTMTVADTVLVHLDGTVLDEGRRPSKEVRWHLGVYRARPDVGGIAHLHPPHAVAFAVANEIPPLVHTAARGHLRSVGSVGLLPAGSAELAEAVVEQLGDSQRRALLMREHGSVTVGPDLPTAHHRTEYLEDNARVALLAAQVAGVRPAELELADDQAPLAEVGG